MHWITRCLAGLGVIWVLWLGYTMVAPEPGDMLPSALVGPPLEDVSEVVNVIAHTLNAAVSTDSLVEPLFNGDQIFPPMLDAIRSAQESIRLLTFIYWTGDIASEFAEALAQAARRGVSVRVILDAFGSRQIEPELIESMRSAGVELAWYHPFEWYTIRRLNTRTHRKVLVVDDKVGFTGGVGIASEWTGSASTADEWRDNHFRITGPAVDYLDGAFTENWLNATGEMLTGQHEAQAPVVPDGNTVPTDRLLVLPTSPGDGMSPIALSYWAALKAAKRRVDINTPYFLPDRSLKQAVMDAANDGLDIRLLVPDDHNDSTLIRKASVTYYEELLRAGVRIFEYQTSMMHTKLMLVDDSISIFGSPNFDNRSFELNDEILLIADDRPLFQQLHEQFENDLESAVEITLESEVLPSGLDWLTSQFALMLREQL